MQRCRAKRVLFSFQNLEKSFLKSLTTIFFVAALFFLATTAQAASYTWSVTSGGWSVASNWGGTEPTSGGTAYINNGGTASITASGETCGYLYLGQAAGNTGSVSMTSGDISTGAEYVGYSGTGFFNQSGGSNNISSCLCLGYEVGSTGIYTLSGGQLSAPSSSYRYSEYVGYFGKGFFTQTGGTHTIASSLCLGMYSGSSGSYALNSGELTTASESVGYTGTGNFTQSAGINTTSLLSIGNSGTYTLTGGTLNLIAGLSNKGTFNLTGSTATINATSAILDLNRGIFTNAQDVVFNLDSHSLLIVPSGFNPSDYFSTFRAYPKTQFVSK